MTQRKRKYRYLNPGGAPTVQREDETQKIHDNVDCEAQGFQNQPGTKAFSPPCTLQPRHSYRSAFLHTPAWGAAAPTERAICHVGKQHGDTVLKGVPKILKYT